MCKDKRESILLERIRKGEEHAFEIAYLKYHNPLCQFIFKYVRSKELAKEIVQEVYVEIWEDRKQLDPSGHLRSFLYKVARNKALDYIKHKKIVNEYVSETKWRKKEDASKHFKKRKNYKNLDEEIRNAISNLPPRGRQVFKLNRNEGLTYQEISEYLDISVNTVETHMRRVLQKLRNYLSKYESIL